MSTETKIVDCEYCGQKGDEFAAHDQCGKQKTCMTCTRPAGHDGPHMACGVDIDEHPIEEWEDE